MLQTRELLFSMPQVSGVSTQNCVCDCGLAFFLLLFAFSCAGYSSSMDHDLSLHSRASGVKRQRILRYQHKQAHPPRHVNLFSQPPTHHLSPPSTAAARPAPGLGAYCIAKAGIEALTRQTALEFAGRIRCKCVQQRFCLHFSSAASFVLLI